MLLHGPGTNTANSVAWSSRAWLAAGRKPIHLRSREFWVRAGYSEGFKREWQKLVTAKPGNRPSSVDAQWRSFQTPIFLYRRAIEAGVRSVQITITATGRRVKFTCPP